jgi:hypothetical protein
MKPLLTEIIGLASYSLGYVARLMNPNNPNLKNLHFSEPDTAVLYDLLHCWVDKNGQTAF